MPKFICRKCGREFWGWGVSHLYRSGSKLVCPDCEGTLDEKREPLAPTKPSDSCYDGPEAA